MAASPNNTIAMMGTVITDAAGNTWQIVNGQIVVNGVADPTTANVVSLAYENGKVWQMNASRLWWAKSSPSDTWSPTSGTSTSPLVGYSSANNSVLGAVAAGAGVVITDTNNDHWSILNGQVTVNGVVDLSTRHVDALAYENGHIWQVNSVGNWYSKSNAADTWSAATTTTPVTANPDVLITVTLPMGTTTLAPGQDNSDTFVFTGTSQFNLNALPTLTFLPGAPVSVVSRLIVSGNPGSSGVAPTLFYGSVAQVGDLEVNGGITIAEGRLDVSMQPGNRLVIGGPSSIDNNGSLYVSATGNPTVQLDSTLLMGSLGKNTLFLDDVNLVGGQITQNGENDQIYVGGVPPISGATDGSVQGTQFIINGGTLNIAWPGGFGGTIGSNIGSSIGTFGEVDIQNAMNVARGTFDTTTGMMSLLNSAGTDLGDFHFAGDSSGLVLNMKAGGVLAINDHPSASQGNIALTFHS